MRKFRWLRVCAVLFAISAIPAQFCCARDWADYVYDGSFEAIDHVDATEKSSDGILKLVGAEQSSLHPAESALEFVVEGASLATDPASVQVFRDGLSLSSSHVELASNGIVIDEALVPGLNHLIVLAQDADGHLLSAEANLWAGAGALSVDVLDENDSPLSGLQVRLELADDPGVFETAISLNGKVSFNNVPPTTISLVAQGAGSALGQLSTTGDVASAIVRVHGFRSASAVDNKDFSSGLQGWDVGTAPVSLIAHDESGGGSVKRQSTAIRSGAVKVARGVEGLRRATPRGSVLSAITRGSESKGDMDMVLATNDAGSQSVSRTFDVAAGTSRIKVRYRFVTTEAPAGYFGSQYNDNFGITVRSKNGGDSRIVSNSMNRLGIEAFDSNGATRWYSLTLPTHGDGEGKSKAGGETVQIDVVVTNIGDGEYDSAVVIDYVEQEPLSVSSDVATACSNETVTFQVDGSPPGIITWTGGGQPSTGNGAQFVTRFAQPGQMTVRAQQSHNGTVRSADATVSIIETSGSGWVARFPTSDVTTDLIQPFRDAVDDFVAALRGGNAAVNIAATLRPPERAHLMHYSYRIAHQGLAPETVPAYQGMDICWTHRDANGNVDLPASTSAAQAMVNGYGIQFPPALQSRHTQGRAIDMSIAWAGDLAIQDAGGTGHSIMTLPRTGAGNVALHGIGAGYGVLKLVVDPPHWSDDGH